MFIAYNKNTDTTESFPSIKSLASYLKQNKKRNYALVELTVIRGKFYPMYFADYKNGKQIPKIDSNALNRLAKEVGI